MTARERDSAPDVSFATRGWLMSGECAVEVPLLLRGRLVQADVRLEIAEHLGAVVAASTFPRSVASELGAALSTVPPVPVPGVPELSFQGGVWRWHSEAVSCDLTGFLPELVAWLRVVA